MIKVKQEIVNIIGCFVARWIIHNCDDGLEVQRFGGGKQIIKVFSVQAYKNIIKPAIYRTENESLLPGDVVTDNGYFGEIVITRIVNGRYGGYCRSDGKPIDGLDPAGFSKIVGHIDVRVKSIFGGK